MTGWRSTSLYEKNNVWSMCCKKECRCSSFGLDHTKPHLFAESLWQGRPNIAYVVYRIILALYYLTWLVLSGTGFRNDPTWLIFLTNWSFLVLNIRLVVQAYIALAHYIHHNVQGKPFQQRLNWIMKTEWVLYNISSAAAIVTSVLFWVFLFLPDMANTVLDLTSIHTHGVNSGAVLLDIWIAAIPLRFLHFFQPLVFILIYFIFNAVYVFAGGRNDDGNPFIYAGFDWLKDPAQATIQVAQILASTVAVWIMLWLMSWLVRGIASCCCPCCNVRERKSKQCSSGECGHHQGGCVGCGHGVGLQGRVNHGGAFTVPPPGGPHVSTIHL